MMKLQSRLIQWLPVLKNKYVITLFLFTIWITFFDSNNLLSRWSYMRQLRQLEKQKEYYLREIEKDRMEREALFGTTEKIERFAREKYLMKRDNEEIFVFIKKPHSESTTIAGK
jgi:cell division protein FtsB